MSERAMDILAVSVFFVLLTGSLFLNLNIQYLTFGEKEHGVEQFDGHVDGVCVSEEKYFEINSKNIERRFI